MLGNADTNTKTSRKKYGILNTVLDQKDTLAHKVILDIQDL